MEWPAYWANNISIILFAGLFVLLWCVPKAWLYVGAPDQARWRDVRIWASVLILIQIGLYVIFR